MANGTTQVHERLADTTPLKAVLFDVDGTLYRQGPLRRAMALRLLHRCLRRPLVGLRTVRILGAYRRAQEDLRSSPEADGLAGAQLRLTAVRTGVAPDEVATRVEEWMEQAPLELLPRFLQPGLRDLLDALKARGMRLGVLSDYPAEAKLRALGLLDRFDVVLCAQDRDIGVYKPHPRGLLVALQRLGVTAPEALYVGDRVEVDAAAAAAASVHCAILSRRVMTPGAAGFLAFARFDQLQAHLIPAVAR